MKVSIITATYNSQGKIGACLNSVALQSEITNIEHVIVDGNSTDDTLSIVSTYPHVATVISEADYGIYDAFNKGLSLATGDIIYYLNSDDVLFGHDAIEKVISIFQQRNIDFLCARVMLTDEAHEAEWLQNPRKVIISGNSYDYPSHQGFFIRTSLLRVYGGFPRCFKIVADSYIMLKAISTAQGYFSDFPVAKFSTGGVSSSISNQYQVELELEAIYRLLGVTKVNSIEFELNQTKTNLSRLKSLFISHLQKGDKNYAVSLGLKIGIFGTGVMSVLIKELLTEEGFPIHSFFTSNGGSDLFHGKKVNSLPSLREVDVLINCIEGSHTDNISNLCLEHNPYLQILHWADIYS